MDGFFSTHLAYTVSPASTVVQWITLPREVWGLSLAACVSVSFHLTGLLPQTILSVDTSRMGQRVLCACVGQGSGPCWATGGPPPSTILLPAGSGAPGDLYRCFFLVMDFLTFEMFDVERTWVHASPKACAVARLCAGL